MWVIRSDEEDGFWSNEWGWGSLDEAERYETIDGEPVPESGRWVELSSYTAPEPDLLTACKDLLSHFQSRTALIETCDMDDDELRALAAAETAIERAEGTDIFERCRYAADILEGAGDDLDAIIDARWKAIDALRQVVPQA